MRCLLKPAGSPLVVILLFVASTYPRPAVGHEITIFAQPGDVFNGRTITRISNEESLFSINNQREIAFIARVEDDGWVVMTQNRFVAGAGKVVDGVVTRFNDEHNGVWINDLGQVAYNIGPVTQSTLFLDDKILFRSGDLIDGREAESSSRDYPVVDRFGTVAFRVTLTNPSTKAIVTQHGIVAKTGDVIDGFTLDFPQFPIINGDGTIAFASTTTDSDSTSVFTADQRLIGPGDVISGIPVVNVHRVGNVNHEGIVTATVSTGSGSYVATQDEMVLGAGSIIAGLELESISEAHMTADGRIVLLGSVVSDDGVPDDGGFNTHLFAGDELLLAVGDKVDGHTINKFWQDFHINETGDVVVQASLSDVGRAILLITVPEPSTMSLLFFGAVLMLLPGRATRAGRRR